MEFWGIEVKSGESLKVDPGEDKIIHLSNACLGDVTKAKGGEPVALHVKFGNQKLVLGTLSSDKFPQISYDLVFEKEFELSHNWKNGSVFFTGFKAESQLESVNDEDSDDFDEDIPVSAINGKPDANEAKQKDKMADPRKNEKAKEKDANGEDEDSSESDSDDDSSDDKITTNGDIESDEGDEDSDEDDNDEEDDDNESDEEETPKKTETSNKRVVDSSKKTPVPVKKAKFVTPQKTDGKNVVHVATPYPSKQAGKATANNKQQTPKLSGDFSCKLCNRSFKTEDALNSHNKDKHSAK